MLELWLILAIGLVAYVAFAVALTTVADRELNSDEQHRVSTADGWTLTVDRYLADPGVQRRSIPIVLAHGLSMNGVSWELSDRASIPRALASRGYDVWVAAYRGERSATPPAASGQASRFQYGLEDHAYQDVPAILSTVCDHTGAERINWVGHSMGGILIYLYASRFGCDRLHRVVTLSSPVRYGKLGGPLRPLLPAVSRLLGWQRRAPLRRHFIYLLPLALCLPWISSAMALHLPHASVRERLTLFRGAVEDVSWQLLNWFMNRSQGKSVALFDADQQGLACMQAPLLVVASTGDRLAPAASVRPAYDLAGAHEKRWLLYGDEGEAGPAFGHSDLASSEAAVKWIIPEVLAWLEVAAPTGQSDLPPVPATGTL